MKNRERLRTALSWIAGLAILYLIFRRMEMRQVIASLRAASVSLLVRSVALTMTAHFLRILKWHLVLLVLPEQYDVLGTVILYLSSKAFGSLSPARLGEFAPLLSRHNRGDNVATLLLVDRVFEAYATLLLGAIGFLLLRFRNVRIVVAGVVVLVILSVILILLANTRLRQQIEESLDQWPLVAKVGAVLGRVGRAFDTFKHLSCVIWLLSMTATSLDVLSFQLLFLSVDVQVGWPLAATMAGVAAVASFVALTPWGLGFVEAPLWWLGRLYDLPGAGLITSYVLIRVRPFLSTWLPYGLALLARQWQRQLPR